LPALGKQRVSRLLSRWNKLFILLFKQVENLFST